MRVKFFIGNPGTIRCVSNYEPITGTCHGPDAFYLNAGEGSACCDGTNGGFMITGTTECTQCSNGEFVHFGLRTV